MPNHSIEEWFQLYERDITSFLIYYTGSRDVEDLVQETFLIAWRKLATFQGRSHPKTWLISIARNLVLDRYKKRKIWRRIKHLLLLEQKASKDLEDQAIEQEEMQQLYYAIRKLSPRDQEVVILRGILELSTKETSVIIDTNENHINVLYHRALKKLKSLLQEEGGSFDGNEEIGKKSEKLT